VFLTADDVADLTGLKRPKAQIRWLEREKWPHKVGGDGKPKVLRAVVMAKMGGFVDNEPRLRLT
jgi:hypothetical protein